MDAKDLEEIFQISPIIPSPFDGGGHGWGRARVGEDKSDLVHNESPLPFIPSRTGEGRFLEKRVYSIMDSLVNTVCNLPSPLNLSPHLL